jgi:hypothetical protein
MKYAHATDVLNQPNRNSRTFANTQRSWTTPLHRLSFHALRLLVAAALLAAFLTAGGNVAFAQFAGPVPLQLVNGWAGAPFSTSLPTVEEVSGIVQFRGAIAGGTSSTVFSLPASLRPSTDVYIPVDLCNSNNGRLHITPTGSVDVQEENGAFSNAQCFTSLDGASFAPTATGFTALPLINGWTNAPFATSNAAVKKTNGIVHFKGAIASGTTSSPFVMPAAFRPTTDVYVPVDLCNTNKGRLHITPSGAVDVEVETTFSNAQCFTSLDGAWFAPTGFSPLTLINGWTNGPFSTSSAKVGNAYGIVYFRGAIATSGTNAVPFVLTVPFRPVTDVYVPVDLCNANKGRLHIRPSGVVDVEVEKTFSNAQCFTSLEGASFVQ